MDKADLNGERITLRGEITGVTFESADGTYAVFHVRTDERADLIMVGYVNNPEIGQYIEAVGKYETSENYGRQFRVAEYHFSLPGTKDGLTRYLGSGAVPGVGAVLAKRLVELFGENTIEVLNNHPEKLCQVPKIGRKKAAAIIQAWRASVGQRDTYIFLEGLGITPAFCNRLIRKYGNEAAARVRSNPYQLAEEVDGVGFIKADEIARRLGIGEDSPARMTAAAIYVINETIGAGHVGYPEKMLKTRISELTGQPDAPVNAGIAQAIERGFLVRQDELIYTVALAAAELELPRQIARLARVRKFGGQKLRFASVNPQLNRFDDAQLVSIDQVEKNPLTIITGGPGVGKTTVVGEIVRRGRESNLRLMLAAPTGRAAKRLEEATSVPAKTIHRLLLYDPSSGKFGYDAATQLPCDLLIVDEVSMLDIMLTLALFRAIPANCSVVLVGDADQLPSVGPGTVLADLLASDWFAATHLTKVFRQGAGSAIISNAYRVNRGELPVKGDAEPGHLSDFYWIETGDDQKAVEMIKKMLLERIPKRFKLDPIEDVQILTPMNRNSCGTAALNALFQQLLNPQSEGFRIGERQYKLGDKVMQTSNNYDKNVFNGDQGRIRFINKAQKKFIVQFDDDRTVEYAFEDSDQLSLAYAVTVHKAQGCEFKAVILLMLSQHYMMQQRNLLYTAMTRARQLLVLVGDRRSVGRAVNNCEVEVRYSMLRQKLQKLYRELQNQPY